jgi:hypothetical protein
MRRIFRFAQEIRASVHGRMHVHLAVLRTNVHPVLHLHGMSGTI